MLLSFIFDWISDYIDTPEMYRTLSQEALFILAMCIIGAAITAVCTVVYFIGIKILEKKGR